MSGGEGAPMGGSKMAMLGVAKGVVDEAIKHEDPRDAADHAVGCILGGLIVLELAGVEADLVAEVCETMKEKAAIASSVVKQNLKFPEEEGS